MAFSTIYIAGLGLIGGSFAKKLASFKNLRICGEDSDPKTQSASGLSPEAMEDADLVLLCLPPAAIVPYIKKHARRFKKGAVLASCAGVQAQAARACAFLFRRGIEFAGAHPMAGSEKSGFAHAEEGLFDQATMILCFTELNSAPVRKDLELFFTGLGFARTALLSPEEHDAVIAAVSQMPHMLAISLMLMQTEHSASFAGPSLKDMTRISEINAPLWADLFLENRGGLLASATLFEGKFKLLKEALLRGDRAALEKLLKESSQKKADFFGKKR